MDYLLLVQKNRKKLVFQSSLLQYLESTACEVIKIIFIIITETYMF